MIYLDYAANTPVDPKVLEAYIDETRRYIANPNASHHLGQEAKRMCDKHTESIAQSLGIKASEIIYTSGASEANNLAIKGIAHYYKRYGKHLITSYLEHSSVTGAMTALQNEGFEIDFVDILPSGEIDFDHLKTLVREDTILVSLSAVDSELGIIQDIASIAEYLQAFPKCFFHVDATQIIGKMSFDLASIDLMSFAPHKFYGLNGCGALIKKEKVVLEPMIHGGKSTTIYRSGSPAVALIGSIDHALTEALGNMEERLAIVKKHQKRLYEVLKNYKGVSFNGFEKTSPFILNFSISSVKGGTFQTYLSNEGVCISSQSACCTLNTPSRPVYALTKDRKRALSSLRISLSHLVTDEEIEAFLEIFNKCYEIHVK